MSTTIDPPPQAGRSADALQSRKRFFPPIQKGFQTLLTISIGILLCANPWTAVLVVGWTFRLMRRRIFVGWWNQRPSGASIPLNVHFVLFDDHFPAATLPRWLVGERLRESLSQSDAHGSSPNWLHIVGRLPSVLTGSLRSNFRWGIKALLCTLILTAPSCVLWLGSWYDGWNNSFNKGYENALVGLQAGLFAHLLFIVAMLYVPMAWGHLAASGQIRSIFQVRLLARMIWCGGWSVAFLAAVFSLATLPVMALRSAPFAFVLAHPDAWASAEPSEVLRVIQRYQLAAGLYLFPAFVSLHLLIARLYRVALRRTLEQDPGMASQLPDHLQMTLFELDLIPDTPPPRGPVLRLVRWSARSTSNLFGLLAAAILWFTVIAQIYIGQFLNYIPWAGWLNQPLIHLPCLQVGLSPFQLLH